MKVFKLICLVIMVSIISTPVSAEINYHCSFDITKVTTSIVQIGGDKYLSVGYDGLQNNGEAGEPSLPYKVLTFSIPHNASNITISSKTKTTSLKKITTILPTEKPQMTSDSESFPSTIFMDSTIYGTDGYFPQELIKKSFDGFIHGDNRILKVIVSPIKYNPIRKEILFAHDIDFTINYICDESSVAISGPLSRTNKELLDQESQNVMTLVENPGVTKSFRKMKSTGYIVDNIEPRLDSLMIADSSSKSGYKRIYFPSYNYVIISNKELAPEFKKIIALKRQKGLSAGVVCVEDILSIPDFAAGDVFDGYSQYAIADSAGSVRQYLKYAYSSGYNPVQYVLLGGATAYCPIRKGGSTSNTLTQETQNPTDLYFSNLTTPWRTNSSSDYGNYYSYQSGAPSMSFFPDVSVGRLLVRNCDEIDNYATKLIRYSLGRGINDFSYLTRSLLTQQNGMQSNHEADHCATSIQNYLNFETKIIQVKDNNDPTGCQIINDINQNHYGYISFYGHGSPASIRVNDSGYKVTMTDSFYDARQGGKQEEGNGFDCLQNSHNPGVVYSIACTTMPYDIYTDEDISLTYDFDWNIGQSLTTMGKYGAVAFLSNTRYGLMVTSGILERNFIKCIKQYKKLGIAEGVSKYIFSGNTSTSRYHLCMTHNLLGDPEVEMWTDIPQFYTNLDIQRNDNSITVYGITPEDTVSYCDNNGLVGRLFGKSGSVYINHPNCHVMVYKHNYIPYIAPMVLSNCEITKSQYVFATDFEIANDVTFRSGVEYEIDSTGDITIDTNVIVENGATLRISTPGKVRINGFQVQSGATFEINAARVELVKNIRSEKGSNVKINKYVDEI